MTAVMVSGPEGSAPEESVPAPAEAHNAFAGQGAVLLDIGGDVGALVVAMPPEMTGLEVEIRPAGWVAQEGVHVHHPHVAVVVRPTPEGPVPSLVYPAVTGGEYELVVIGDESERRPVVVEGGVVATTAWI
ncbi:hypothetical protein [Nocardioides bigeumensis]|uniref:Phospholipase n=1 Tax=Nocardioides bigeumensis TaxID=433657 RepID=A0ABN2YYY6_9ACTN